MRIKILKKSQVWVETAIYTLIGLTIIAIVLSTAMPQIEKIKQRSIVKQTYNALIELNNEIQKVEQVAGNIKIVYFKIAKGKLEINSSGNKIIYTLENTNLKFSEPGKRIEQENIILETQEYGRRFNIILELDLNSSLDLTYNGEDKTKVLHAGASPYKILIENVGVEEIGDKMRIDFRVG